MLKKILFAISLVFFLLIIAILSSFFIINRYLSPFDLPLSVLFQKIKTGYDLSQKPQPAHYNFLLLGLDKRDDEFEKTQTTDTILFGSLDLSSQKVHLISLPRDLWSYSLNSKINQVYPLAQTQTDKLSFIKSSYQNLVNQPIDDVIVISTQNLNDVIDIIGGVDVYLEKGFKDDQYPNPEYIKNPSRGTPIYKTIEFPQGWVHLDSKNITEFVRSRKSAQTAAEGGTDIGRINRQQLVIEALMDKLKQKSFYSNPTILLKLYSYWHRNIETSLVDEKIISLAFILNKQLLSLTVIKHLIPIGLTAKNGPIYHPDTFINAQWVFIPSTKDYLQLKAFISDSIK